MGTFLGLRWEEWFTLGMLVFTLGAPVFFLIYFYRRHFMDNLDCSKYEVFNNPKGLQPDDAPAMPVSCQPAILQHRSLTDWANTGWFWVTLAIGGIWLFIMLGAFVASRGIEDLRHALPV